MMATPIPVFCDRILAPSIVPIERRSPLVFEGTSIVGLFFNSLYYFGREQVTYSRSPSAQDWTLYAHRQVTPFLKSKVCYWSWIALKGAVQASFVWNWKVWIGLNAIGLFFELKKDFLFVGKNTHFSICEVTIPPPRSPGSGPPPVYQKFLLCHKEPKAWGAFFQGLNLEESQDFCRFFAKSSPEKVAELLEYDFEHEIFNSSFYKLLLDTLVLKNEDAFLSCYLLIRKHPHLASESEGVPGMRYKRERFTRMREAILKSLSWTSPLDKGPQIAGEQGFSLTVRHLPALQQIFPYLSNNDRARAAQCCKLFRRVVSDLRFVPAIQRDVGPKLLWFLDEKVPVDIFSKGQIEKLLKTAYQQGAWQQHQVGERLLLPRHDVELWKFACEFYLSLSPHIDPVPSTIRAYQIYSAWDKETLSEEQKLYFFDRYHYFLHKRCVHTLPADPLMELILEKKSAEDKKLACFLYLKNFSHPGNYVEAAASFLALLRRYLLKSPEALQTFFTAFRPFLKAEADQFDPDKAAAAWQKSTSPLPLNSFIDTKIAETLFSHAPLYNFILTKLQVEEELLLRHFLAARLYRKDPTPEGREVL